MGVSRVAWRKSSRSTQNGSCVEVAVVAGSMEGSGHTIAVRDSKDPKSPVLAFGPGDWRVFTNRVKAGGLDLG